MENGRNQRKTRNTGIAGGNGWGNQLNQLKSPSSIYISDTDNHRIMKWERDAKEGVVAAAGNEAGSSIEQLNEPRGVIVDDYGQIYVADSLNNRIMRWNEGMKEGEVVLDENAGEPTALRFDSDGNLYAADEEKNCTRKFDLIVQWKFFF
ncbi:unnamed protein product [Adineta ricciae]|uniref:Uncharacterized protein n=1 Tax=Adineta ricciae TaxID=249248 RepID=A0A815P775_ADIRI|nr:unnamed protein product [Adineta ricciae]CAF1634293.1 unnamed protein product [Adineta ricciae]